MALSFKLKKNTFSNLKIKRWLKTDEVTSEVDDMYLILLFSLRRPHFSPLSRYYL